MLKLEFECLYYYEILQYLCINIFNRRIKELHNILGGKDEIKFEISKNIIFHMEKIFCGKQTQNQEILNINFH